MTDARMRSRVFGWRGAALLAGLLGSGQTLPAQAAATLPEIRLSVQNTVPACVTPERLMAFLERRNGALSPRFRTIAAAYKKYGEAWRVRWDYAFFQMAIETNFLTYRQANGRMGDVDPRQNNFAGIGTTGGGVSGDSFPDVATGVLGQIQHLVVYSGEEVADPVAPRTRLKQEHILEASRRLNRSVRFSDLARRWAADPKYGRSIEWVAERYRAEYCKGGRAPSPVEALPWQRANAVPSDGKAAAREVRVKPALKTTSRRDRPASPVKAAEMSAASPPAAATAASVSAKPVVAEAVPPAPQPAMRVADAAAPVQAAAPPSPPLDGASPSRFALLSAPAGLAATASRDKGEAAVSSPSQLAPDFSTPPSGLGVQPDRCFVETAKYGGETNVLVKAPAGRDVHYIAVAVLPGFEATMTQGFLASRPEGGETLGTYPTRDAALARARQLCAE